MKLTEVRFWYRTRDGWEWEPVDEGFCKANAEDWNAYSGEWYIGFYGQAEMPEAGA